MTSLILWTSVIKPGSDRPAGPVNRRIGSLTGLSCAIDRFCYQTGVNRNDSAGLYENRQPDRFTQTSLALACFQIFSLVEKMKKEPRSRRRNAQRQKKEKKRGSRSTEQCLPSPQPPFLRVRLSTRRLATVASSLSLPHHRSIVFVGGMLSVWFGDMVFCGLKALRRERERKRVLREGLGVAAVRELRGS